MQRSRPIAEALEARQLFATTISGTVFDDANGDGVRQDSEAGRAAQQVVIDENFDGRVNPGEPVVTTNSKGQYIFTNVGAGVKRVALLNVTGRRVTTPGDGYFDVASDGFTPRTGNNFGSTTTAVVRGVVFRDLDGDGQRGPLDTALVGWRVFIDKNNNGVYDPATERSRLTNADGAYRFAGLAPGRYSVRIVSEQNSPTIAPVAGYYRLRLVAGHALSNRNFAMGQPEPMM